MWKWLGSMVLMEELWRNSAKPFLKELRENFACLALIPAST